MLAIKLTPTDENTSSVGHWILRTNLFFFVHASQYKYNRYQNLGFRSSIILAQLQAKI